jgi:Rps23 Pro-64 3,4-dihydroxylase Tpa1-like proline 4-hydroxylase
MNLFLENNLDIPKLRREYENNEPFPHMMIDNLFKKDVLDKVLAEFPPIDKMPRKFLNHHEYKYASKNILKMKNINFILYFLNFLNSKSFIQVIEKITGIDNLIPDIEYHGGGLHQIPNQGKLDVHVGFNKKNIGSNKVDRRVNLLLYLNEFWEEKYQGNLELWDGEKCIKSIPPLFNRTVIFNTTSKSWHGHPKPLNSGNRTRKSIAIYYYTINNKEVDFENLPARSTIFL